MRQAANVRSLDAIAAAKAAVAEFREVVKLALSEASAEVQRTHWWLQNEQPLYWRGELKKRNDKLQQAKSEYHRAQLQAINSSVSTREQRKLVDRAQAAFEEAEKKAALCRRWAVEFERESLLFRGALQPLQRAVEGDLERATVRLDQLMDRLDAYLKVQAPESGAPRASGLSPTDASPTQRVDPPGAPSAPEGGAS